ncbi:MAG: phosphate/phosphite/phosphonate ABC transporter substrate-binding protein [Cyanothece sp. SIO1E1]|nr:phosphate/phosphite/phosphonate ABC transporter substrate-binding protein [Cyanothece sp. SIO1E1]
MSQRFSCGFCGLASLALFVYSCARGPVINEQAIPESSGEAVAITNEEVMGESVRFGVLAIDSAVSVNERYTPLMQYLSEKVGRPFELVILSQESQFTQVEQGKVDFTTNNPLAAVQIRRLHDTEFLVTHTRPNTGPVPNPF